MIFKGLYEGHL